MKKPNSEKEQNYKRGNAQKYYVPKKRSQKQKTGLCSVAGKCGGCQYLAIPYETQLREKQKQVDKLLSEFAPVDSIIGMKNPFHYRNKIHAVLHHKKNGVISGIYEKGTHKVLPVESCLIENQRADAIIQTIRKLIISFKLTVYNEDTGYGLLRHVLIRTGYHSGQILVVLVTAQAMFPSRKNFVTALRKAHPEITAIVQNINEKQTSMVLGEREIELYGKKYIEDTLCEKTFRISPKSFYQINSVQTEILYETAIRYAGLTGTERILDAYCGIGTIGIIAGDRAKEVIGVELNKDAVKDARINARANRMDNISFYQNDAGKFMTELAAQKIEIDVVFMDPPRAGSDKAFMDSVAELGPKRVVYISCNPVTLARDLKYMSTRGYRVERITPVDMFPMTEHVETVVLLQRKDM